jgi:hypothetical protein
MLIDEEDHAFERTSDSVAVGSLGSPHAPDPVA